MRAWILMLLLTMGGDPTPHDRAPVHAPTTETPPDQPLDLTPYTGKVVVVDFWASWCEPCEKSFPWLMRMDETYRGDGLVVVAVNVDADSAAAQAFLERYAPEFIVQMESGKEIAAAYDLAGMPSSFVYDRAGVLRESHVGFRERDAAWMESRIVVLLNEPAGGAGGQK